RRDLARVPGAAGPGVSGRGRGQRAARRQRGADADDGPAHRVRPLLPPVRRAGRLEVHVRPRPLAALQGGPLCARAVAARGRRATRAQFAAAAAAAGATPAAASTARGARLAARDRQRAGAVSAQCWHPSRRAYQLAV
ncbi:hypothetical protein IWQ56_001573, partial [Coemansia nantahalensis]